MAPATAAGQPTRVLSIFPSAPEVPLNLLKLYVVFSAPMSEGWAGRAVQVHRADTAQSIRGVFLPMEPELWDHRRSRLTLLLDPGRIKRGLAPHAELGYPLRAGVPIVVTVDPGFRDAHGRSLATGIERRYAVGPAERRHVEPSGWRLHTPRAESVDPLRVDFNRPLDRALLEHALVVQDARGRAVYGQPSTAEGDRAWSFTPDSHWRSEPHRLRVDPHLEDLAGNSLSRVFDRDLTRADDAPRDVEAAMLEFAPR